VPKGSFCYYFDSKEAYDLVHLSDQPKGARLPQRHSKALWSSQASMNSPASTLSQ